MFENFASKEDLYDTEVKTTKIMKRNVAIVGRPNVGKSTLFNRLVGNRHAIVDDESGVTRDRIFDTAEWEGKNFTVVDTGGFVPKPEDIFEESIKNQIETSLEEAGLVLFMVDVRTGITKEDEAFAELLRKRNKQVLVIANKADNHSYEWDSYIFYSLGFSEVYALSSLNGSGTTDLLDRVNDLLNSEEETYEDTEISNIPKFAILGRPNTGKSTLVNALLGEERNIVTDVPGTTRDSIKSLYNKFNRQFEIIDTAGLRKKKRVKENLEFYSNIRAIRAVEEADVSWIMLDAEQGLEAQDISLINLVKEKHKGMILLINKWDAIEKDDKTHLDYIDHIQARLNLPMEIPVLFISALEKTRLLKAIDTGIEIYQNMQQKISTSSLNEIMLPIIERNPPPTMNGKHISIKYVTQLSGKGLKFAFFCNHPTGVKAQYKKFLERTLRKHFSLKGVPISLLFKSK